MKVLSVDVGIQHCGYLICLVNNLDIIILKEGQISPRSCLSLPEKLNYIFSELENNIKVYEPSVVIVETLYSHHKHPTTIGVLAQVRGIVALLAWRENLAFYEYSPRRARKSFVGKGSADSTRVKKMAENVTGQKFKSEHTADAYSLVIAFSHEQKLKKLGINYR